MGTAIVLIILAAGVFFAARSLVKDRRDGKNVCCGGDCGSCRGCRYGSQKN